MDANEVLAELLLDDERIFVCRQMGLDDPSAYEGVFDWHAMAECFRNPVWQALCFVFWRPVTGLVMHHVEVNGIKYVPSLVDDDRYGRLVETVELPGQTKAQAIKQLDTRRYEFIEWL